MQHVVSFTIQEDNATGEWGFYPDSANGMDFNTSWLPHMLFHDVFEHFFEGTGYFTGDAAFNIGGEVAAMGAMSYYLFGLGIDNRARTPQWGNQRYIDHVGVVQTTFGEMEDAIKGYSAIEVMGNMEVLIQAITFIDKGLAAGKLKPVIDKVFPFEQTNDALEYVETGRAKGKVVIKMK